ncbi:hypothetical protein ACN38_g4773 [Penicillium nordicum]|uniref:Uncharacterized protein n=1 Tax=Penicillium nordicum TaxID=229535 RepID=A0A0M8P2V2_9EURO|nr:hypothetical protein ACN38_g4773 [Penicillium nordicum]
MTDLLFDSNSDIFYILPRRKLYYSNLLQPASGLASCQKTIISEHYAQIVQAPIYIVHDMTELPFCKPDQQKHH